MPTHTAVEVQQLVKSFRSHRGLWQSIRHLRGRPDGLVLDNIDLRVEAGEVVGITGANGAGKTTLLKIVATIISPTAGRVSVHGMDTVKQGAGVRSVCTYAFGDDRSFYWRLTGRQNLQFFAALNDLHGAEGMSRILETAESLSLDLCLDQPFRFYSAGIRQRFALARALLTRPRVLLLDEPTRSIDRRESAHVWHLVRRLADEGTAVLLATHSLAEAVALCDRILLLQSGRLTADLDAGSLSSECDSRTFIIVALGLSAATVQGLYRVPGVRDVAWSEEDGEQRLELLSGNGDLVLPGLFAALADAGVQVRSLERSEPFDDLLSQLAREGVALDR